MVRAIDYVAKGVTSATVDLPGSVEHHEGCFGLGYSRIEIIVGQVEDISFTGIGAGNEESQSDHYVSPNHPASVD